MLAWDHNEEMLLGTTGQRWAKEWIMTTEKSLGKSWHWIFMQIESK